MSKPIQYPQVDPINSRDRINIRRQAEYLDARRRPDQRRPNQIGRSSVRPRFE